jgi:hypothetical protein
MVTDGFVRRLGIDVKALGKLVDKYMNFEDAANSAAQLSQAFGLNVDAFKLMQEQDPAKKLEMLRKGFFATGRTIENMTAQERRLLAQQTGLGVRREIFPNLGRRRLGMQGETRACILISLKKAIRRSRK